ncbi:MAG: hypothetical protein WBV46_10355 [Terriglobales bacterium]|jgi:hypothetical protein
MKKKETAPTKLRIPVPFEHAIAAALETKPERKKAGKKKASK